MNDNKKHPGLQRNSGVHHNKMHIEGVNNKGVHTETDNAGEQDNDH